MTALQVRDFPPALLEELKFEAARQHRSVSQQTIYYIEQALHHRCEAFVEDEEAKRLARQKKRERIFEMAKQLPPIDDEAIKRVMRESRQELEERADWILEHSFSEKTVHE